MKVVAKYPSGGERRDIYGLDGGCRTLSATDYKQPISVVIPVLTPERANKRQNGRRFKDAGEESFTLTAIDRHGVALGINIQGDNIVGETDTAHCLNANDQRKVFGAHQERTLAAMPCIIDEDISPTCIGGFGEKKSNGGSQYYQQDRVYDGTKLATALATNLPGGANNYSFPIVALSYETTDDPDIIVANLGDFKVPAIWYEKYQCYIAIRKLTPKECFTLQGWTDDYFEKAAFMNSDSQLYKQAGNGITVNVVEVIAQKLSPEKPLTFVDLFAGIGGFRRGMELAGHNCVGFCEWDKYARASYISMHCITEEQRNYLSTLNIKQRQKEILNDEYLNGEWTATDIHGVTGESIPRVDCWGFGAPCFVAGTLITTSEGLKPIEDVQVGDTVLTHTCEFHKVEEVMNHLTNELYELKVMGSPITQVTGNHRFWVRYKNKVWNNDKRNWDIVWTEPEWKPVEEFNGKEYCLFPNNQESNNPENLTEEDAWLLGRYVADGYLQDYRRKNRPSNHKRIAWCIGKGKEDEFRNHIQNIKYFESQQRTALKFISLDKRLFSLCEQCGKGAENKIIPPFIMNLPVDLLNAFIDGYMSGDGSYDTKNNRYKATSVSKKLIFQLGECINKTLKVPFRYCFTKREPTCVIEGRTVNQKDSHTISFAKETHKQDQGRIVDNKLWMPVRSIKKINCKPTTVYNLEVEKDHSYTANGIAVHNCQDFSVAGRRKGLDGDRSSLIREVFRILEEIREEDRPEWIVYENVKGMFSSNRGFDYLEILLAMEELGYDVEWQLFNSKDWGVPQNRERVYTIGHLRCKGRRKILPIGITNEENNIPVKQIGRDGTATNRDNPNQYRVYDTKGICPTLNTMGGGGREPMIPVEVIIGNETIDK